MRWVDRNHTVWGKPVGGREEHLLNERDPIRQLCSGLNYLDDHIRLKKRLQRNNIPMLVSVRYQKSRCVVHWCQDTFATCPPEM